MRKLFDKSPRRSHEIVDIIRDVVKRTSRGCVLNVGYGYGDKEVDCPDINYIFGNAQYVKTRLDELSKASFGSEMKFPVIVLFCPVNERRGNANWRSIAKVRVLIACSSTRKWSNEEREVYSFEKMLRPIYRRFLEELKADTRLDFGSQDEVAHEYSENYTYGRYGAYTGTGEEVSEPIDAINITNLELKVNNIKCR